MPDQKMHLDIRIVKFQDYIRRKPDKAFGYYGLGVQYMLHAKPALADRMFMQALKVDPNYTPARLGKLEFLLSQKKWMSAARFYHKNKDFLGQKNIHNKRVQLITSKLYTTRGFYPHSQKLWTSFVFREGIGTLQKMFNNGLENPVVNLLLAMFFLKEGKEDDRARVLYNLCVGMEGITDRLRWDFIQVLSKEQPDILKDSTLAGKFSMIPEDIYGRDYASFLIHQFMKQGDHGKVLRAFTEMQKNHASPSRKVLWQYVSFCRERNILNPTLAFCCHKLIGSGWVDSLLANTVKELKSTGLLENTREIDKVLATYGYMA